MKENIRNIDDMTLIGSIGQTGEKAYRAKQVMEWIWKKGIVNFDEMSNIPQSLKNFLNEHYAFLPVDIQSIQQSTDQTLKILFGLHDNKFIEGVLIPSNNRVTACISSQVGCKLKCRFCATGTMGFKRNLDPGEIFDQVWALNKESEKHFGRALSNIVLMGMGEPLYNYINVNKAIHHITSKDGMGISPKRITLSTIGIPVMIKKMADDKVKYNLALSLHSAIQEKRARMMPVARNHTLEMLLESLVYFTKTTGEKVTIEYVLLKGMNDGEEDARALVSYCGNLASKVNLIEYNPIDGLGFEKTHSDKALTFMTLLKAKGMNVHMRKSRGGDIDAACGQLANKQAGSAAASKIQT